MGPSAYKELPDGDSLWLAIAIVGAVVGLFWLAVGLAIGAWLF